MENNFEKFSLSSELKQIFKNAFSIARENHLKEIGADLIVSCIIDGYAKDGSQISDKDKSLEAFFQAIPDSSKEEVIKISNKERENYIKLNRNVFPNFFWNDSSIVLSEHVNFLLKKIDVRYSHEEINSIKFLACASLDSDREFSSEIMKKLKSFGINYETLYLTEKGFLMSNIEETDVDGNSEVLKEKTLSFDLDDYESESEKEQELENDDREFEMAGGGQAEQKDNVDLNSTTPYLDKYSFDMTKAAREGMYDKVVGRDKEISQVIEILSCRKKSNCIIIADPGTGKTTIVEGLAQKIVDKDVPRELLGKRICSLDLNALVAGCQYRGMYEERLNYIKNEVKNNKDIIVFIDEIHNLVGNGSSEGNGDGANILKPALARNEFQCIGSTTIKEYKKFIEKDGALKRRFQNVIIKEPTKEETIEILTQLAPKYEEYHHVKYTPEVINACVDWSGRYINDRYFPDKAIDLMDISGSVTKLHKIINFSAIENLEKSRQDVIKEKIELVEKCEFEEAQKRRDLVKQLDEELEKEKNLINQQLNNPENWPEVSINDVASVISKLSNIPVNRIKESDMEKLREMKKQLEAEVIGQQEAIDNITLAFQKSLLDLQDPNKPISSIFMIGPTGVGKSLICKKVAELFFGDARKNLLLINMGEMTESYSISKLIGSAPGYVASDSNNAIFEKVRDTPNMIIVFDEIEKAHPDIYDLLLGILDTGKAVLSNGIEVSFKNCIITFTSNIGTKELQARGDGLGFNRLSGEDREKDNKSIIMKALKKRFRPEFINRLNDIIIFSELGKDEMRKIFDIEFKKLYDRLLVKGYDVKVSDKLRDYIISNVDTSYGARDLQRGISHDIENEICKALINDSNLEKTIIVDLEEGDNKIKVTSGK